MFKETVLPVNDETDTSIRHVHSGIRPRFDSIDLLRGIVMVLMALDHVRDYFTNVRFDPLDLSQTTIQLFLTRWITHFCAPVFIFLAGTGAFLSMGRGKLKGDVTKYLLSRGLWLILLEFTLVRIGWTFGLVDNLLVGQVIWVLGLSMVFLSFLIYLPLKALAGFSLVMILFHNLFDGISPEQFGSFSWIWTVLHVFAPIKLGDTFTLFIGYPLIPWLGVMGLGYCFGSLYNMEAEKRKKILFRLGLGMIAGFLFLRLFDFYGDANQWMTQKNFIYTLLDFLDTTKYPPSLLYLLMTLGPAILILSFLEKAKGLEKNYNYLIVFGRVPLFYYLLHIPLIHLLAVLVANATGYNTDFMFGNYPFFWQGEWGYSLPVVYLVWIVVVIVLYPVCYLFYNLKKKKKSKILSYL
jgi:uncharacterized membrane protein